MATTNVTTKSALEQFLETPQNRRLFEQERLFVEVTELLTSAMDVQGITRAELAQRLGKTKSFVTQVLRGRHNMTLRTLAGLFDAIDCRVAMDAKRRGSSESVVPKKSWTFDAESCWKHGGAIWRDTPKFVYAQPGSSGRPEFGTFEVAA